MDNINKSIIACINLPSITHPPSSSPTRASCRCGSLKAQRRVRFVATSDSKPVCPSGPRLRSPPPEAAALLAEHLLLARPAAVDHGSPSDDHETPPATAVVSQVHHARQKRSWDCGLTAALMILSGRDLEEGVDWARLRDAVGTESVWTIDLAHLLRRVRNLLHTQPAVHTSRR